MSLLKKTIELRKSMRQIILVTRELAERNGEEAIRWNTLGVSLRNRCAFYLRQKNFARRVHTV
jgi:hypothetical protein